MNGRELTFLFSAGTQGPDTPMCPNICTPTNSFEKFSKSNGYHSQVLRVSWNIIGETQTKSFQLFKTIYPQRRRSWRVTHSSSGRTLRSSTSFTSSWAWMTWPGGRWCTPRCTWSGSSARWSGTWRSQRSLTPTSAALGGCTSWPGWTAATWACQGSPFVTPSTASSSTRSYGASRLVDTGNRQC